MRAAASSVRPFSENPRSPQKDVELRDLRDVAQYFMLAQGHCVFRRDLRELFMSPTLQAASRTVILAVHFDTRTPDRRKRLFLPEST